VYQSARVDECAELHLRAAAMIRDRVLSIQHRLAAANGPDEQLAAELYQLGWQQMQQGNAGAVESFRAAARLAQSAALRQQAMVDAFECSMMAGDVEGVSAAAVQLQTDAGPWQRYVEGCLALVSGDPKHADMVLTEVWNRTDSPEPLRARAACQLAVYHVNEGRPEAVLWAKRGVEVPASELPPWLTPATCLSLALAEAGRADEALDFARHARPETLDIRTSDTLAGRGIVKKWTDDLDGARTDLLASFENYRRLGSTALSLLALYHLAEAEYRAGAWDISITHGELAVSLMEDMNHLWVAAQAHAVAAMPLAGRGLYDEARAHVQAASQHAAMRRDPASALYCATADALVAHARREFDAVVRALEPLQLLDHVLGMDEPGIQPWHALLADAFIELGRIDEAEAVVAGLEAVARPRERQTALHAAAAARARIAHARGERDAADGAFQHAALLAADLPVPFARAQFELAYGRFLRRTKRRAAAVTVLRAARDRFTQLGAKP
jgi:tetratricopeptide (TPR) repeat protein